MKIRITSKFTHWNSLSSSTVKNGSHVEPFHGLYWLYFKMYCCLAFFFFTGQLFYPHFSLQFGYWPIPTHSPALPYHTKVNRRGNALFNIYELTDAQNWLVIDSERERVMPSLLSPEHGNFCGHGWLWHHKDPILWSPNAFFVAPLRSLGVLPPFSFFLFFWKLLFILLQAWRSVLTHSDVNRIIVHIVSFLILSDFILSLMWKWNKRTVQLSKLFIV